MQYALVENGRVTRSPLDLPASYNGIVNFRSLSDAELKTYGWYPVNGTEPDHDSRVQTCSGPAFTVNADDVNAVWTVTDKPLASVKADLVAMVKSDAYLRLLPTDRWVTRNAETGAEYPAGVTAARAGIRAACDLAETNINAATTVADAAAAYDAWDEM